MGNGYCRVLKHRFFMVNAPQCIAALETLNRPFLVSTWNLNTRSNNNRMLYAREKLHVICTTYPAGGELLKVQTCLKLCENILKPSSNKQHKISVGLYKSFHQSPNRPF